MDKARIDNDRVTFSVTGMRKDLIGTLYTIAKALGVYVVSVIRNDLNMYREILNWEENSLNEEEAADLDEIIGSLSMSYLANTEGIPSKDVICDYLASVGKSHLCIVVSNCTIVRLGLIQDRARTKAANARMKRTGRTDIVFKESVTTTNGA